ncbi:MAG TPA: pyrimidine 5'-nucleotidase [Chloroflexi bacterium]|nr:pyrimidine 5'-nucleotidase [Chloroflexota bacterium]|tara:strand:+ start:156 stop:836 length:681 start_codon:yes stop_codon:yes gene_type:complete
MTKVNKYRWVIFDVDDTLYSSSCGLWFSVRDRIHRYLVDIVGISEGEVESVRDKYFQMYGTCLAGLQNDYEDFNTDEYVSYVHDVEYERFIGVNETLEACIEALPLGKALFTNSDKNHATKVIRALGIEKFFSVIVDVYATNFVPKPAIEAYQALFRHINASPDECIFLDDQERNLQTASDLGMTTILVSDTCEVDTVADFSVVDVVEGCAIVKALCLKYANYEDC